VLAAPVLALVLVNDRLLAKDGNDRILGTDVVLRAGTGG
jgi:hypothetical protein